MILVSPIYSFGLPNPVKDFIKKITYKDIDVYIVLHYGGFAGNAKYYAIKLFKEQCIKVNAVYTLKMPETYTLFAQMPKFIIDRYLKKSNKTVKKIANNIKNNKINQIHKNIFAFTDEIHNKNSKKWKYFAKEYFSVNNNCNKCGYCQKICPSFNIIVDREKGVMFGKECVSCLACYHRCPKKAINYGGKTVNSTRYQNPNVDFNKMN